MDKEIFVGSDLGETTFWAALAGLNGAGERWQELAHKEFAMTKAGVHAFVKWVCKQGGAESVAGVCAEAVGPLAWRWVELLGERLGPVSLVNPRFTSEFGRSLGVRDKTDRVDACVLALYGQRMRPPARPLPSKTARQLQALSRLRQARQQDLQAFRNRLRTADWPQAIREEAEADLVRVERHIAAIRAEMLKLIKADPALKQDMEHLVSIPGVGEATAMDVLAELGDLRQYSRGEITALAGLYPRAFTSGTSVYKKPRIAKTGNMHLRKTLYMPAMVAAKHCPCIREFTLRLKQRLTPKQAIVAAMRKLLLLMRAVVKNGTDYDAKENQQTKRKAA